MSAAVDADELSTTAAVVTAARREALGRGALVSVATAVLAAIVVAGGAAAREVATTMVAATPGGTTTVLAVVAPNASARLDGEHTRHACHDGVLHGGGSTVARVGDALRRRCHDRGRVTEF